MTASSISESWSNSLTQGQGKSGLAGPDDNGWYRVSTLRLEDWGVHAVFLLPAIQREDN